MPPTDFLNHLPIVYVLTVVGRNASGATVVRGLFIGDDPECFLARPRTKSAREFHDDARSRSAKRSSILTRRNFTAPGLAIKRSTGRAWPWPTAANCSSSRRAFATFGEDPRIDKFIRKYGYHGTPATLADGGRQRGPRRGLKRRRAPDSWLVRRTLPDRLVPRTFDAGGNAKTWASGTPI